MRGSQIYREAAVVGMIAGLRSMSAPALITRVARKGQLAARGSKLEFLNSTGALSSAVLLAAGEIIADKFPKLPARIQPGPLTARAISGALCGAVLCSARKKSPWRGALYGALGAIGAAYAAYHLRHTLKETLHVPDAVLGVAEDAIVTGSGLLIASRLAESTT
jgi:uncharacterized membrane protein